MSRGPAPERQPIIREVMYYQVGYQVPHPTDQNCRYPRSHPARRFYVHITRSVRQANWVLFFLSERNWLVCFPERFYKEGVSPPLHHFFLFPILFGLLL